MDLGLQGKTALVHAGGGGLGGAIASALAQEGAAVAVADISPDGAKAVADRIAAAGGRALALDWDLADLTVVDERAARIEKELGAVDILVNMTGGPPPTTASGQDPALWVKHFHAMILSVIAVTDRFLPGMRQRKWGRIVTSTSSGVVVPIPNLGLSNSLRPTLVGWSKTLAREVARDGVTANIIVPGVIATRRIVFLDEQRAKRDGKTVAEVTAENTAAIPLGRYGEPAEYAAAVAFLASRQASYITGSVFRVDGGMIAAV